MSEAEQRCNKLGTLLSSRRLSGSENDTYRAFSRAGSSDYSYALTGCKRQVDIFEDIRSFCVIADRDIPELDGACLRPVITRAAVSVNNVNIVISLVFDLGNPLLRFQFDVFLNSVELF